MMLDAATLTPRVSASLSPYRIAARIIVNAAHALSNDDGVTIDARCCRGLSRAFELGWIEPDAGRAGILAASPFIFERSGQRRTLVKMIASEEGDEAAKLRLARLLLRTLDWR